MITTTASIRSLCSVEDIKSQGISDGFIAQRLADNDVWLSFQAFKTDMDIFEKGLLLFISSRRMNSMYATLHFSCWNLY